MTKSAKRRWLTLADDYRRRAEKLRHDARLFLRLARQAEREAATTSSAATAGALAVLITEDANGDRS